MTLSIIIVTYNSIKYLPHFIDSIIGQSYFVTQNSQPDIFIVDNASTDKTVKLIKDNFPSIKILRNVRNVGLCRAWNQAIESTQGEYILIMNPDLTLHQDFIKHSLARIKSNADLASVGGKLLKLKVNTLEEEGLANLEKTNILDSCGIVANKNRSFYERGAGQVDKGQFNNPEQVFGISGACMLLRRQALEYIKFGKQYFDENFFMYKEDVDLAWRLRLAGYVSYYEPQAIAYHHRRAKIKGKTTSFNILKNRLQKEDFINFYSYRNHLMLLLKNESWANFSRHFIYIFFYELKKFIFMLILENSNLTRSISYILKNFKSIYRKRKFNKRISATKPTQIRQWFE